MFDLPRFVGVSLLLTAVALQAVHVQEIKDGRAAEQAEMAYRAQTIGAL